MSERASGDQKVIKWFEMDPGSGIVSESERDPSRSLKGPVLILRMALPKEGALLSHTRSYLGFTRIPQSRFDREVVVVPIYFRCRRKSLINHILLSVPKFPVTVNAVYNASNMPVTCW